MKNSEKMWAILINFGVYKGEWFPDNHQLEVPFDEEVWDYIVEEAKSSGLNTIVLEIGGAIDFLSHPELTLKGAWSHERLRAELKRCKDKNIALIPKLNFSAPHDAWLGEYSRMVSTSVYYEVCNDLIKETYELFDHPKYIHIGMDEEDAKHVANHQLPIYRQGELYWNDVRFLIDCVKATGATPWMWSCPLFDHPEEYKVHIGADDAILSPWYYNAFRKEHWTPISSREVYMTYYNEGQYAELGLKYVEEDPFLVNVRNQAVPLLKEGYKYVPCASTINKCDYNTSDLVEYFKENTPDEQLIGFITAPWRRVVTEYKKDFEASLKFLKEAKDNFYN